MSETFIVRFQTASGIQQGMLCGWDVIWGPAHSLSFANAVRFSGQADAQEAADTANTILEYTRRHVSPWLSSSTLHAVAEAV